MLSPRATSVFQRSYTSFPAIKTNENSLLVNTPLSDSRRESSTSESAEENLASLSNSSNTNTTLILFLPSSAEFLLRRVRKMRVQRFCGSEKPWLNRRANLAISNSTARSSYGRNCNAFSLEVLVLVVDSSLPKNSRPNHFVGE